MPAGGADQGNTLSGRAKAPETAGGQHGAPARYENPVA
ncbi:hypothetical protein SXCC_02660 [Gluconacetobacter sp. SXCC-1]|nr:hypothetical protein SXCC_02660 [Gluconacetobacter sp. SXCC-1]